MKAYFILAGAVGCLIIAVAMYYFGTPVTGSGHGVSAQEMARIQKRESASARQASANRQLQWVCEIYKKKIAELDDNEANLIHCGDAGTHDFEEVVQGVWSWDHFGDMSDLPEVP